MRQANPQQRGLTGSTLARLAYVGVLFLATQIPFGLDIDPTAIQTRLAGALDPRITPKDAVDAVRNVALFAGWGVLWVVSSSTRSGWKIIARATASGALLSLTIETLQLLSATRNASVLDLVTNTSGSLVGALTIVALGVAVSASRGRRSFIGVPAFLFAGSYIGAVFVEALFPLFRRSTLPVVHGGPLARLAATFDRFELSSILTIPLFDLVLFLPAGALGVAALVELDWSYKGAAWLTVLAGLAFAALAEIGHGVVGQPIVLGAIASHSVGIALGAWMASHWLPGLSRRLRGPARPAALLMVYAAILLLWAWRPFLPELDPQAIAEQLSLRRLVPLQAHRPQVDLFSVADVATSFLLFFPLGSLLAVWPLRLKGRWRHVLPALYLACLVELGQVLLEARFFDVTDVLIAGAASFIGWSLVRRAGYRPYGELSAAIRR